MAVTPTIDAAQRCKDKAILFKDTTDIYDSVLNITGYGSPNETRANITATSIEMKAPDGNYYKRVGNDTDLSLWNNHYFPTTKDKEVAILIAEQAKEVALENKLRDAANAEAAYYTEKKKAETNALLVKAGLTPIERARINMETRVKVAHELAQIKFPEKMFIVGSGNGKNGGASPIEAIGVAAYYDVFQKMSASK